MCSRFAALYLGLINFMYDDNMKANYGIYLIMKGIMS